MTLFRHLIAAAVLTASAPTAAIAQAKVAATPGMAVQEASGTPVGSVVRVDSTMVFVNTGKHEIPVPLSSFTASEGKLLLGMSQAQLNAAYEQSAAAAAAALVVGAPVKGSAGTEVGTIDAIDSATVTIKLSAGQKVQIPRSGIAGSANGAVIGMSAEQLEAQVSAKSN